ncbi:MAG TPA: ClbS/DfsB family four-helix bundle protein [Dehalococcoidia bacterium]|nr:ClbS/DfsB family four-helix bundle protein [Dehalococcoidia bacterium]
MPKLERLISDLETAHDEFVSTVKDLDERRFEEKWLDGRWGAREIAAHHTGWLGQLAGGMERMSRGEKPSEPGVDWSDPHPWNEMFAERAKGKRQDQVLRELGKGLQSFIESARKLPEDRFEEGRSAHKMFEGAGIAHFHESAEMIRRWREREALTRSAHN